MELETVLNRLREIDQLTNEHWMANLAERKRRELAFHDEHRDRAVVQDRAGAEDTFEKFYGNRKYYSGTADSRDYLHDWLAKHAPGKIFLDYCCGDGVTAIKAAKAGAKLAIGVDISRTSVTNARSDAAAAGLSNTFFVQADAENTMLPDNSVDLVICNGVLHHLDLSHAFPELRRVLKPGGRILALEALDYNPVLKLYRHLTPAMRTEWETNHILSLKDVEFAQRFFDLGDLRFWHMTTILSPHYPKLSPFFINLDRVLMKTPGLKYMAWMFTFELIGRQA